MARVTLEQWRMFEAVVRHGGFAQAAQAIHKSQSTINHAVHKLQDQLQLQLLEVRGRKAELTEAGSLMLRRAEQLLAQAGQLEDVAAGLVRGEEAQISIAVDEIYPTPCLANALCRFSEEFPNTRVQLLETVLSGGEEKLQAGEVDLLVAGSVPRGYVGDPLLQVDFVAVAAPHHPLHSLDAPLAHADLARHRQLVIRDSARGKRVDSGWLEAEQRWTVSHIATSIDMISRGMGFAWLPLTRIEAALQSGQLRPLPLERGATRQETLYLTYANRDRAGPGTCRLDSLLQEQAGGTGKRS
jgi:DNA-binding transcriptional LysR family regulator